MTANVGISAVEVLIGRVVGAAGFELATPCTPCKCATRLRYAPTGAEYSKGLRAFSLRRAEFLRSRRVRRAAKPDEVPRP